MKIELQGVHLDKENKLSVSYKLLEVENSGPVAGGPFTGIVHPDLIAAMAKLSPHIALMTKAIEPLDYDDIEEIPAATYEDFSAKSFSTTGEGDKLRIVISGNRKDVWGKVFNFNTPAFLVNQKEESDTAYDFMADVKKWMERIKLEASAFLDGSKRGKDPQGNLFANKGQGSAENPVKATVTKMQIAPPEGPKKEWTAGEYLQEVGGDEKGVPKFAPGTTTADPEAMKRLEDWKESDKAQNGPKKAAVANQAGSKGRKKGGAKRVKQTSENPSGIVEDDETE